MLTIHFANIRTLDSILEGDNLTTMKALKHEIHKVQWQELIKGIAKVDYLSVQEVKKMLAN